MDTARLKPKLKRWGFRAALALFLVPPPLVALYLWSALHFSYSNGNRVGYVQKLSERGWICKTYEGELAMVSLPGQPAELFPFTVRSAKVANEVEALQGHRVALDYEQHKGLPTSCFGDTEYFVVGVRKVD